MSPTQSIPKRPLATTLTILTLWIAFYASFTLFHPALLDDADSVHAEVAREMLLRHDWVTLYANGIRYLEKAPLLYWSMATCMGAAQMLGHRSPEALAVAARIPLALTVLALAFAVEAFARRAFRSSRAGLYAGLILLSSPGVFLFTRTSLPDAMLCLWLTLALLCFWLTEESNATEARVPHRSQSHREGWDVQSPRLLCFAFAAFCALGVLTKGLIGILFPVALVAIYLLLTRGPRNAMVRIGQLQPIASAAFFLLIAAPWHILMALANPTQGHPGSLTFAGGHWQVPLPTDGNVHGWTWFYFVNEQLLRYLNLRVPRDYDTVPLYLFWGLLVIWLMPWSAFVFKAIAVAVPIRIPAWRERFRTRTLTEWERASILLLTWSALPLLFFSLSTRQEYYVLPALPALCLLLGYWLWLTLIRFPDLGIERPTGGRCEVKMQVFNQKEWKERDPAVHGHDRVTAHRAALRCTAVLIALGAIFAVAALFFLLRTHAPNADLAALLQQNPSDYAMSMGHFLDLNAQALGLFRMPLALAAASLLLGPLASYILRRVPHPRSAWVGPHAANLALAAGAFGFLLAAHLGLQTFAPVLTSQRLAADSAPQLRTDDLIVIHQEYEYGSTLGFYLQRPSYRFLAERTSPPLTTAPSDHDKAEVTMRAVAVNPIHILTDASYNGMLNYGRSSNLWYGSFFTGAPAIFETAQTLAQKWRGPQRIFLWQDLANQPSPLPASLTPFYVIAKSGGNEIVSNQPNRR
ncbi:MAG: phospholipid carrier-dependent glycosyltransferase [Acidobacteriota bacterium]|nr:phospholipid carrier-dependent glycosyltransferase [Acidobacteriota bacterium]